jgi:hypothetical protein
MHDKNIPTIKTINELAHLCPSSKTNENDDDDFIKSSIYELANIYDRIIIFLRWSTVIGTLIGLAMKSSQDIWIWKVWFVGVLLVGFFAIFLPDKVFVRKVMLYLYERKLNKKIDSSKE